MAIALHPTLPCLYISGAGAKTLFIIQLDQITRQPLVAVGADGTALLAATLQADSSGQKKIAQFTKTSHSRCGAGNL